MKKSDLKIAAIGESNLEIDVPKQQKSKDKQRTEKWHKDRLGRWTGSQMKSLMTCSSKGSRMTWNDRDKLFHFSTGALKYIYENAMERKSGKYMDMGDGTKEMQYGTRVEPLIAKLTRKKLEKMGLFGKVKSVGFRKFPDMPNAGVSSDGVLMNIDEDVIASVEMKACTNWGTHYERTFELTDESSKDFWQTQAQMVAWSVDVCYYVVAEPPIDIKKYLYYEGDIMDLYKEFKKECPITIETIKASKMHQEALLKRIDISEKTVNDWLSKGGNLKELLYKNIDALKNYM